MAENKTDITNYYPSDINDQQNEHRKISLLVKKMGAIGNIDKFLAQVANTTLSAESAVNLGSSAVDTSLTLIEQVAKSQTNSNSRKFTNLETLWGCALPLPNELSENQSHQWESTEGLVGATLGNAGDTNIMGSSVNKLLGEVANKTAQRKALVNPGYFQDYRGTKPREFNFTWDLIPNSKEEADQIYSILLRLKKYTLPTTLAGGLGLLSPYLFDIKIGNWKINTIMNMNNVVCVNMAIGYSADNALQMFGDGTPKHMTLQMSFAERSTVLADDYNI